MPVVLQWLWLIGGMSLVKGYIHKCVTCRRLRSRLLVQKMSDLPSDRLQEAPPFTYTGVDMFGPFIVRKGRSDVKRYGALFTCLSCRAIHIEVTDDMSTDSFINAYRRFVCRRGSVRELRCGWVGESGL